MRLDKGRDVRRGGTVWDRLGDAAGPGPPEGAKRATFPILEPEGMSCDTGRWIVRALLRLDASVWVEARGTGPLHVTDRGRWAFGGRNVWARYFAGEDLTVYAAGPDAEEALRACGEMAALEPSERKGYYRSRHAATRPAGTRRQVEEAREVSGLVWAMRRGGKNASDVHALQAYGDVRERVGA